MLQRFLVPGAEDSRQLVRTCAIDRLVDINAVTFQGFKGSVRLLPSPLIGILLKSQSFIGKSEKALGYDSHRGYCAHGCENTKAEPQDLLGGYSCRRVLRHHSSRRDFVWVSDRTIDEFLYTSLLEAARARGHEN